MLRIRPATIAFLSLLALPSLASAKLAPLDWQDLVKQSALVVRARLTSGELEPSGAGRAQLEVLEVLKGNPGAREITLSWSSEVHDQAATNLGGEYILFLKSGQQGRLEPASYGRSLWPLKWLLLPSGESRQLVEYLPPISSVVLPDSMLTTIQVADAVQGTSTRSVRGVEPAAVKEAIVHAQ